MKVLITGAAGFTGGHAALSFLRDGATVVGADNLSRRGTAHNLAALSEDAARTRGRWEWVHADIRSQGDMERLFHKHRDVDAILHLAGQVAVTTSIAAPRADFEANALGTLNVLEAMRHFSPNAVLLYSSTNKVYGSMKSSEVTEQNGRYGFRDLPLGVSESQPLDFHSPYGCSKGTGDQYVRDYARIYGLKTVVLRQSCIYGTRQFGIEDQGWVAWFTLASVLGKPITVYGDGKQVRDVLWVEDLIRLYRACIENSVVAGGQVYNAGGGAAFSLSLLELLELLSELSGRRVEPKMAPWRHGDQKCFVADISRAQRELGWKPTVTPPDGVRRLWEWARENHALLQTVLGDL